MAEQIFLPPFIQVILEKLAPEVGKIWCLKDNTRKLQEILPMVEESIEYAEELETTNIFVKNWLGRLKPIVHDSQVLVREGNTISPIHASKVKSALDELEKTMLAGLQLKLETPVQEEWERRETSSFVVESEVYGREEEKREIVELLLSAEANPGGEVSCVVITGIAGLGKTTLAQLAYNDLEVTQYFNVKIWVFVSPHFDAKKIMIEVIESLSKDRCHYSNMERLHSELRRLLHKKRYLIVLDDVWTEDQDDWDKVRPLFGASSNNGSKIVITTQRKKVGRMINYPKTPVVEYELKVLSEDNCWLLFRQRAFQQGEEEKFPNLLRIGREIVRKCGGVALAAKSLGSLMLFKREEREWLYVRDNELWNLDEGQSGILPALRLSYSRLPLHLKRCFSFCSIFPKGYEINKEKLIHLWIAEGLICQSSKATKQPEDVGSEYFNDLLWMSFFQKVNQCDSGGVVSGYKMHDVLYNLAQFVAKSRHVILEQGYSPPSSFQKVLHSSVVTDFNSSTIPEELYEAKGLRTLLLISGGNFGELPDKLYSNFKHMLVLDLSGSGLVNLSKSVGFLHYLRFLDLSHTDIKVLPPAIENLPLQTLNLFNCNDLVALPNWKKMRSLRHLNNAGCEALIRMLPETEQFDSVEDKELLGLNELQTLPLFVVGGVVDLKHLGCLNLHGSLKVTNLEKVNQGPYVLLIEGNIESLELYWGKDDSRPIELTRFEIPSGKGKKRRSSPDRRQNNSPEVQRFQLPLNLKRLLVEGYPGILFPSLDLPYLTAIDLIDFKKCEHLPVLGDLPFLNSLSLRGMHGVAFIEESFYGERVNKNPFRALRELVLVDFPSLEEWRSPPCGVAFPCLDKLIVSKCPQLNVMPLIASIQHLELRDCQATIVNTFQGLTSLRTLVIEKVRNLFCFAGAFPGNNPFLSALEIKSCSQLRELPSGLENLTSLKSLTIRWCVELYSLPQELESLDALESLEIGDCYNVITLPQVGATGFRNLRTLSIENCENLKSLPSGLQNLKSLENLTIMYCPGLGSIPQAVEHLSALRSLTILSCPRFNSLPNGLQDLKALHSLEIRSCPGLDALPEWIEKLVSLRSLAISDCKSITSLPGGMKCLTALQHLSIQECPGLIERCRQQGSEDWQKIEHVPYKHIGSPELRNPNPGSSSNQNI
ncbi:hypothetical protein UlMin_042702 [Ulmus minor]